MQCSLSRTGILCANFKKSRTLLVASLLLGVASDAHGQWTVTNLNGDAVRSMAYATSGGFQYGYAEPRSGERERACRWYSTAATRVMRAPLGSTVSAIYDVAGGAIVGQASFNQFRNGAFWPSTGTNATLVSVPGLAYTRFLGTTGTTHVGTSSTEEFGVATQAGLWTGTPLTYVNLQPPSVNHSGAFGVSGNTQVGFANDYGTVQRACKWSGTQESYVSLHPTGQYNSVANDIDGEIIVGSVGHRAAWWTGPESTWSTLHPRNQSGLSYAHAVSGNVVVGYTYSMVAPQAVSAIIWFGGRNSWIDLGSLLPPGYFNSTASDVSIDATGISVVGSAISPITGAENAFLWRSTGKLVSGNLVLQNTSATGAAGNEAIDYTITNGINAYTGSVNVNRLGGGAYSFSTPFSAPNGAYTLRFKGGTFLSSSYNVNVSGPYITVEASLRNGDIDQDGEVGPVDFEAVVAQFGDVGNADVDNDGEVGPSDFEIIVANFGLGDE